MEPPQENEKENGSELNEKPSAPSEDQFGIIPLEMTMVESVAKLGKKKKKTKFVEVRKESQVKCIEKFHLRKNEVQGFFKDQGYTYYEGKENPAFSFKSSNGRTPVHVICEEPLTINVDHSSRKGTQKLTLSGKSSYLFKFDSIFVNYHCGIKYSKDASEWNNKLFREGYSSTYKYSMGSEIQGGDFVVKHFNFSFGKLAKKEIVMCATISLGMGNEDIYKWPCHIHVFVKKNNRTENQKFSQLREVSLDYFIRNDIPRVEERASEFPSIVQSPKMEKEIETQTVGRKRKRKANPPEMEGEIERKKQKVEKEGEENNSLMDLNVTNPLPAISSPAIELVPTNLELPQIDLNFNLK